jgi:hypothetical protein
MIRVRREVCLGLPTETAESEEEKWGHRGCPKMMAWNLLVFII